MSMVNKILIVEDDLGVQEYLKELFLDNRYTVESTHDGLKALELLKKSLPDLVLLDLGLPTIAGEAVCIEIRKYYPDLPVVILTGKDSPQDVVQGLNLGADDYIIKPFMPEILLARVNAKLRDKKEVELRVDDLTLNSNTFIVKRGDKEITLTPHEFKLLHYLMSNKDKVLTREMILNRVWEYSYDIDSRVVDVYVGYLRKKIDSGYTKKLIQSVRGFGYTIKE